MGNPDWIQLMKQGLSKHVDPSTEEQIMRGWEKFVELDEHEKATWMSQTVDRLDQVIADEETKIELLTTCSCTCYTSHIDTFKKIWQETSDLDRLLAAMYGTVFMVQPIRKGNTVYITKAPHFPEEYAKARTPEEKRYYFCHCDHVRALTRPLSKTYCYCGAGWCKAIFEQSLGRKVKIEIVKTVLDHDDCCQFAVHI